MIIAAKDTVVSNAATALNVAFGFVLKVFICSGRELSQHFTSYDDGI
jgi:hypothetical protein